MILDKAFGSRVKNGIMSKRTLRQLKLGSNRADNFILGNQRDSRAYIHAMKSRGNLLKMLLVRKRNS